MKLGNEVGQPSPFAYTILVPQASICCLLIWLRRGAMKRERLPSLFSQLKDRISLFFPWSGKLCLVLSLLSHAVRAPHPISVC